jgi:hypothetical protein
MYAAYISEAVHSSAAGGSVSVPAVMAGEKTEDFAGQSSG